MAPKKQDVTTNNSFFIQFFRNQEIKEVIQSLLAKKGKDSFLYNNLDILLNGTALHNANPTNMILFLQKEQKEQKELFLKISVVDLQTTIKTNINTIFYPKSQYNPKDDLNLIIHVLEWLIPTKDPNEEFNSWSNKYTVDSQKKSKFLFSEKDVLSELNKTINKVAISKRNSSRGTSTVSGNSSNKWKQVELNYNNNKLYVYIDTAFNVVTEKELEDKKAKEETARKKAEIEEKLAKIKELIPSKPIQIQRYLTIPVQNRMLSTLDFDSVCVKYSTKKNLTEEEQKDKSSIQSLINSYNTLVGEYNNIIKQVDAITAQTVDSFTIDSSDITKILDSIKKLRAEIYNICLPTDKPESLLPQQPPTPETPSSKPPYIFPDLPAEHKFTPYLVALFYPPEVRKRIRNRLEFMYNHAVVKDPQMTEEMKKKLIGDIKTPKDRADITEYLEEYYSTPYENLLLRLNVLMDLLDNAAPDYAKNKEVYLEAIDPEIIQYELQQLYNSSNTSSDNANLIKWLADLMNEFSTEGMECDVAKKNECILNPDDFIKVLTQLTNNSTEELTLFGSVNGTTGYFKHDQQVYAYPSQDDKIVPNKTVATNAQLYVKITNLAANQNANGNNIEDQFAASLETVPLDLKTVNYLAYLTHLRNTYKNSGSKAQGQSSPSQSISPQSLIDSPRKYIKDDKYHPCNYDDPSDILKNYLESIKAFNTERAKTNENNIPPRTYPSIDPINPEQNKLYYMCVFITLVEFYIRLNKFNTAITEFKAGHKPPKGQETNVDSVYVQLCSKNDCKSVMEKYGASDFSQFLAIKPDNQTGQEQTRVDAIIQILVTYIKTLEDNIYNILNKSEEDEEALFKATDEMMKDIEQITQANAKVSYDYLKTLCDKVNFSNVTKLTTTVLGVIKYPDEKDSTKHSTLSGIIKTLDRYHSNFASRPEFNLELDKEAYLLDQFGKKKDEFKKYVSDIFDHNAFNTTLLLMYNVTHKHILTQLIYELVKWCLLVKHEEDLIKTFVAKEGLKEIKDQIHEGLNEVLLYIAGYNAFFNKAIYVMLKFPTLQDYYSDDFEPLSNTEIESPTPPARLELQPLVIFKESQEVPPTIPPNNTPAKTQEPEPSAPPSPLEFHRPPPKQLKAYDKFDKYKKICGKIKELLTNKNKLNEGEKAIAVPKIENALINFNKDYPSSNLSLEDIKDGLKTLNILQNLPKDNLCNIVDHFTNPDLKESPNVTDEQETALNTIYEKLVTFYETLSGAVRVIVRVRGDNYESKGITIGNDIYISPFDPITQQQPVHEFGPFYRVVGGENVKNKYIAEIIYPERVLGSLTSGQNVLIFTYGYSGSGKTYTLFGKDGDQGILQEILDTIANANVGYTLESITKHYGYLDVDKNKVPVFREDVKHLSTEECPRGSNACAIRNIYDKVQEFINDTENTTKSVDDFIKSTVNNLHSSRGYVFIKFKVGNNYLTFVDMAGSEDPYDMLIKLLPTYYIPSIKLNNTNFLTHKMARNKDAIFADVFEQSKKFLNDFTSQINEITFAIGSTKTNRKEVFDMHQKLLKCFFAGDQDKLKELGCRAQSVPGEGNILLMNKENQTGLAGLFMSVDYHKAVANYLDKNFKYLKAYSVEQILNYMKLQPKAKQFRNIYGVNDSEKESDQWKALMKVIFDEKGKINLLESNKLNDDNLFVSMTKASKENVPEIMKVGFTDCPEIFDVWSAYLISQKITKLDDKLTIANSLFDSPNQTETYQTKLDKIDAALAEVETAMYKELYVNDRNTIKADVVKNLSYIMFVLNVIKKNKGLTFAVEKINFTTPNNKVYGSRYFKFSNTFYCMEASKPNDMTYNTLDTYFDNKQIYAYNDYYSQGYLERTIKEAFYINQANADLVTYFKNQMARDDTNTSLSDPSASTPDKKDKKIGCKLDYNSLLIEGYDQNLCVKPVSKEGQGQDQVKAPTPYVTNIVKHIQNQTGDTKNIMICTVRSEPDVKYRLGAIKTLELVKDLKST